MSRLRIFEEDHPDQPIVVARTLEDIGRELQPIGVTFERWEAAQPVKAGDAPETIMR